MISNVPNAKQRSMCRMADQGDAAGLREALAAGEEARFHDDEGLTPLMRAARRGRIECVELLALHSDLDAKANLPRAFDYESDEKPYGATALLIAIQHGRRDCAKALLAAGADPDEPDCDGLSPLMAAALFGDLPSCEDLCLAGASLDAADRAGRSAFSIAKQIGARGAESLLLSFRERRALSEGCADAGGEGGRRGRI